MIKNILSLYVVSLFNLVLPVVFYPYTTKVIGVQEFANFIVIAAYFQYATIFIEFGSSTPLVKYFTQNETQKIHLYDFYLIRLVFAVVVSVLLFFILNMTGKCSQATYFIGLIGLIGVAINPISVFQAKGILHLNALLVFLIRLSITFYIIFMIYWLEKANIENLMAFQFLYVGFSSVILNVVLIRKKLILPKMPRINYSLIKDETLKKLFSESFSFFISTIFTSSYTLVTPLILDKYFDHSITSAYGLIDRVSQPLKQILMPVLNVVYPKICMVDTIKNRISMVHHFALGVICVLTVFMLISFFSWDVINLYVFKMQLSKFYIYCMIFNVYFVCLSQVALFVYVVPFNGVSVVKIIYMVMAVVFFLFVIKAIDSVNSFYIFYAMVLVEVIGFVCLLIHGLNMLKNRNYLIKVI